MANFADLQRDSGDLGELVNENKLVATRYGGNKKSWQYLVDQFEAEFAQTLLEINKSRGYRVVGTFAAGFNYELFNDVGIDASGNSWIYVGAGAPAKTVTAGTVPSDPDYQQVTFNSIDGVVGLRDELNDRALYLTTSQAKLKTDLAVGQRVRLTNRKDGLFEVNSGLTANERNIIALNNGLQLQLVAGMVTDFEHWYDEGSDQATAWNELVNIITGSVVINWTNEEYNFTDRITTSKPSVTIVSYAKQVNLSGYTWNGTQNPFGNLINFTADGCGIRCVNRTLFQLGVTDGNAVGWLHCGGGFLSNCILDGNKDNITAITDDTFQSGISFVNTTAGNPRGTFGLTVDDVEVRNFVHYGHNIYGNLAKKVKFIGGSTHSHGNADAESTGGGYAWTRGMSEISYVDVDVYNNKKDGALISSAGENAFDLSVAGGKYYDNGNYDFSIVEETQYGSVVGQGMKGITVTGVQSRSGSGAGFMKIGTYNDVGYIRDILVSLNVVKDHSGYAFLLQTNATVGRKVENARVTNNIITGNQYGMATGTNLDLSVYLGDNEVSGSTINDYEMNSLVAGVSSSFTPFVFGSTAVGSASYNAQIGKVIVSDGVATFDILIDFTGFTGTGDLKVGGFPVAASPNEALSSELCFINGMTVNGLAVLINLPNSTDAEVRETINGTSTPLQCQASGTIRCSGTYRLFG